MIPARRLGDVALRVLAALAGVALAITIGGCASHEVATFQARLGQESIVRDGQAALVSRAKNSIVLIRPAARQFAASGRPVFVVGINNMGPTPLQFRIADIEATQTVNGQVAALQVITYEQLVQEERNRQVAAAVLTGLAAGANAYSASQAGKYNSTSTVYTPHGTYQVNTVGYSPTAAAIAQANASAQNEAMISATIERGQQNLANLEQAVIKDDTVMPGEWYGGTLHLQPLSSSGSNDAPKTYSITLLVGQDRHEIDIVQTPVR
jgi:hypothetical protein